MSVAIKKRGILSLSLLFFLSSCTPSGSSSLSSTSKEENQDSVLESSSVKEPSSQEKISEVTSSFENTSESSNEQESSSESVSDISDSGHYEAIFKDGSIREFVSSNLTAEEYFRQNYASFEEFNVPMDEGLGTKSDLDPMYNLTYTFTFGISNLPLSFEVSGYRLYESFKHRSIQTPKDLDISRDNFEVMVKTNYADDANNHRAMYLYALSNGETNYYFGFYSGGTYLDLSTIEPLRVSADEIQSIEYTLEDYFLEGPTLETTTITIEDFEKKEDFANCFVDPILIETEKTNLFWTVDGYRKSTFVLHKNDQTSVTFEYYTEVCRFIYQGISYFFDGELEGFTYTLMAIARAS